MFDDDEIVSLLGLRIPDCPRFFFRYISGLCRSNDTLRRVRSRT